MERRANDGSSARRLRYSGRCIFGTWRTDDEQSEGDSNVIIENGELVDDGCSGFTVIY